MWVRLLTADSFRNLRLPIAELSPGINVLCGDNAQGKTNFLEAVYFCALGRPLRADHCRELIPLGTQEAVSAKAKAVFHRDGENKAGVTVSTHISLQSGKYVKSITLDRVPIKNTRELFGKFPVVSFSPEDLRLVKAGPAERRRFMDIEICQLSPVYYQDLREYYRAMRQRNHLLKILQKDRKQLDSLGAWDGQLVKHGLRVMRTRASFIAKISDLAREIHAHITRGAETLALTYKPGIPSAKPNDPQEYAAALDKHQARDIALGSTGMGVHRDDVHFAVRGVSARSFGSQGQQRTAALSVKLAEIELMRQRTGTLPILLLDDVFSELDAHRQRFLLDKVKGLQVLLTCTGIEDVPAERIIRIKNGEII
jgi:DNA replication and repair protein RecF